MADGITITVQSASIIAMLGSVGPSSDYIAKEVGLDTAKRIVAEMQRRVARGATGKTAAGIHYELMYSGDGYVVVMGDWVPGEETARRTTLGMKSKGSKIRQMKHTGIWLEYGTPKMYAKPFFWSSADLESGPHLRRLEARLAEFLVNVGR